VSAIILIIVLCSRYIWQVFRCKYSKARQKSGEKKTRKYSYIEKIFVRT